jgi:hypothetical protein
MREQNTKLLSRQCLIKSGIAFKEDNFKKSKIFFYVYVCIKFKSRYKSLPLRIFFESIDGFKLKFYLSSKSTLL